MSETNLRIQYETLEIEDVVAYFVRGYGNPERGAIEHYEWYMDPIKQKFIFKLFIGPAEVPAQSDAISTTATTTPEVKTEPTDAN